jgi:flagellar hook assembly protein FlgD
VRLGIYDVAGRCVRSLMDEEAPAGIKRVQWDGKDQAGHAARTGMYFARLSGEFGSRVVRAAFVR